MEFTYESYFEHIKLLKDHGYTIVPYGSESKKQKMAILRHDVDYSLESAVKLAEKEAEFGNDVKSTYFVLLRTDFYNVFSAESQKMLRHIQACGHEIGLHFDETFYSFDGEMSTFTGAVKAEKNLLEQAIAAPIRTVSMHRPSKEVLNANLEFEGLINSYSQKYFNKWKYVSDSRMHWREDLSELIKSGDYERIHILTHAFWYAETAETAREKLLRFINSANSSRFDILAENIRDIEEFVKKEDI